ncbi:PTS system trehalose-specific EIIBC component [Pseudalkalibacillus decolorationis]|uniref:PTS system trehalose-specific EIIBC component n=1 Tax=Pseudalkalibacillus decolorationis TaxID=163879 RepID=UPI0021489F47|nr:PTS system trehalose-specific EIIBC component [Pseudalkalibacillus decolorationis]
MTISRETVLTIVEALGGRDNIDTATHCVTRLRLALHDEGKVDKEKLESVDIVKGSFSANGQFQVVIGQGTVDEVYKKMVEETGIGEASKEDVKQAASEKLNPLQKAVKVLADIFIPILPAIVTAGLLMGLNNVLVGQGIFYDEKSIVEVHQEWGDLASIINLIANTAFVFLPALIGWSAVKRFGGSPLLGIVLGLMLVHPDLLNAWAYGDALKKGEIPVWNIFGLTIEKVGYQGQVLPVLVASYVLARLEQFLNKRIPDSIKLLLVAPITLLVTGFLAFILIGPITFAIGNVVTDAFVGIFDNFAALGGIIYGGFYSLLVITGMHHTFLAVDLQLISNTGGTFLWPMLALSNIAQGSSAFAMMFATKDDKLKGLAGTSGLSAYLGITEPAMFGVNIRFKYPFVFAMIGSAVAGLILALNSVTAFSIGIGGVPGFLSIKDEFWGAFFTGMAVVIVVPFVSTFLYAKIKKGK